MPSPIPSFVRSLDLPDEQAIAVLNVFSDYPTVDEFLIGKSEDSSMLTSAACAVLKLILGEAKVNSKPANATLTDDNWLVSIVLGLLPLDFWVLTLGYRSQTCWKSPRCVVLAESKKDVSVAIKIIKFLKLKFATRSGGHSPNPGWSSIGEDGILIDLQKLNAISVSDDKKVASIGPGQKWGKVYEALDPHELSVIGGRIPQVGVGGLILGGGFFHFSGKYGLAADNVKDFEVVLADGSVVNANADSNSDLFWALKGGGPNFGKSLAVRVGLLCSL
jgi:hypothetical protein